MMKSKRAMFVWLLLVLVGIPCSLVPGEKLTEEQMTAYRTRPAVVLIYSGMYADIALKGGETFKLPNYGSGSGFFINSEGYLVTNGHVVDIYVKYVQDKGGYAQKVLQDFIVNKIVQEFKQGNGREPNSQEIQGAYNRFMQTQEPRVTGHDAINYVVLSNSETFRFEVKKFSPSVPDGGKDIAVLKIERDNCPIIMLGDSADLALQQKVFTIGFPGAVDPQRFPLLGRENTLKSSITAGAITALKTDYKGMAVIQHDAATSPGNSGGPTVDSKGQVVGVHSYAATQAEGFKFCVPINTAKEFIRETGIETNKASEFTTVFNNLMDAVWQENWFDAQNMVSTALAYMKNEPDLERLQRIILQKISGMNFFERIWQQHKAVVFIVLALVVLIIVVLKKSLGTGPADRSRVQPEPLVDRPKPAPVDKTKAAEESGTVLEGDVVGTMTVLVKGEEAGSFSITSAPLILGRDPGAATAVVKNEIVSKTHLKIIPRGDQFYLVDLGSTNGTFVNGKKITETLVTPVDQVQIGKKGDIKLIFKK